MTTTATRRAALSCALLASAALSGLSPASAQQILPPQKEYYLGEGEVDLYHGTFQYSHTDLASGPASEGGLTLTRYANSRGGGGAVFGSSNGHSLEVAVYRTSYREDAAGASQASHLYHVVIGRHVRVFDWNRYSMPASTTITGNKGSSFQMSSTTGPFVFTGSDGTVVNFGTLRNDCDNVGIGFLCSPASTSTAPSGAITRFHYDLVTRTFSGVTSTRPRLRLVTNSHGWAIGFQHQGAEPHLITKACALNLSAHHATATSPCPADARSSTYAYSSDNALRLLTYTDPAGQTTQYGYGSGIGLTSIRNPGSTADDLVIGFHPASYRVTSQTYANGATWTYAYQQNEHSHYSEGAHNEWTEVTSPLGHKVLHDFMGTATPRPSAVTDEIGRVTRFEKRIDEQNGDIIERRIEPEGNYVRTVSDPRENAREDRRTAKHGSTLSDIVTTASFPASCVNQKTCNKPDFVIDARLGRTDFTYDPTHGGVLTETGPAVNGVRPQKRYSYAQKFAWVKDASGALVQSPDPVWVLAEEAECLTTASCSGGTDEVRTVYEYGSAPGPLLLRGKVVDPGGLSLRTCYGYDGHGNKISETSPRAGLAACP